MKSLKICATVYPRDLEVLKKGLCAQAALSGAALVRPDGSEDLSHNLGGLLEIGFVPNRPACTRNNFMKQSAT